MAKKKMAGSAKPRKAETLSTFAPFGAFDPLENPIRDVNTMALLLDAQLNTAFAASGESQGNAIRAVYLLTERLVEDLDKLETMYHAAMKTMFDAKSPGGEA